MRLPSRGRAGSVIVGAGGSVLTGFRLGYVLIGLFSFESVKVFTIVFSVFCVFDLDCLFSL